MPEDRAITSLSKNTIGNLSSIEIPGSRLVRSVENATSERKIGMKKNLKIFATMVRNSVYGRPTLVTPALYKTQELPKSKWRRCNVCDGTGSYLESADAHRSEGWVPCSCGDGIIRRETVVVRKAVYRVKAGSRKKK